jgi:hypothetical protein
MATESVDSRVAIGRTDGHRYIFVKPPLTKEEINVMEWAGVLTPGSVELVDEFDPACSLVRGAGASDVQERAQKIAYAVGVDRECQVQFMPEEVPLVGQNSTPFTPNTDALRRR